MKHTNDVAAVDAAGAGRGQCRRPITVYVDEPRLPCGRRRGHSGRCHWRADHELAQLRGAIATALEAGCKVILGERYVCVAILGNAARPYMMCNLSGPDQGPFATALEAATALTSTDDDPTQANRKEAR